MGSFLSRGTIQPTNETASKRGVEARLNLTMTTPNTSYTFPDKFKQDVSAYNVPDDSNLTLSILDELGNSNVSESSIDLQPRFQRWLLAESALESSSLDTSKNQTGISQNEFTLGTSTPRSNKSSSSIFGESDKQINEEFEALLKQYYSEDFIPADSISEKASNENSVSRTQEESALDTTTNEKSISTLSVTNIEDILSKHLQDTPGTIARIILNPKSKTKTTLSQDNSFCTMSEQMSTLSDNLVDKTPTELSDWIQVCVNGAAVSEVDFGILPECCSQLRNLEIRNYSGNDLPLTLDVEEVLSTHQTFSLCKNEDDILHANSSEECLKVNVAFKAPSIQSRNDTQDGFVTFSAYLNVAAIISSSAKPCLLKKLKLQGRVGVTQLLVNFTSPIQLSSSGPGISSTKTLSLKNGGVVPLSLKLMIVDSEIWQLESSNVLIIDNPNQHIFPGKITSINLVFTPSWVFEERINRKLVICVAPDGNLFGVDIHASIINDKRDQGKERLSCQSSGLSQSTGSVSASSSRSITGMPVQTTHKQLVWNTVPVGNSEMQSCHLRNDWPSAVKVLLTLVDSSHGFWLLNENGEHVLERKMRLHAKECVPVNVIFSPSKVGVAYGKIFIREAKRVETAERFAIPLSGYCGTFNLSIRNIPKDKSGNMWINLGPLDSCLQTQFTVLNKGNLESFIFVKYIPKGVGALLQGVNVSIEPSKTVIAPGSNEIIRVSFVLQNDLSFISKDTRDVLELGNLYVTYGDEPTRQRIRRIKERQRENPTLTSVLDLEGVCSAFPGETPIFELSALNDSESSLHSLCRTFQQNEIALTVGCFDDRSLAMQTCVGNGQFGNQSLVSKSMLPDAPFSASVRETGGKEVPSWSITPSTLILLVPRFASGCFIIASTHQEDQMFEIHSSADIFSVEPTSGIIPGMGEAVVVVTCNVPAGSTMTSIKSTLKVYLESDMKIVTVHIKPPQAKVAKN